MESQAKYTLVGSVALILAAAVVAATLWLSDRSEETETYTVLFREHSLAGLDVDSTVSMRGIRVGRVRGLEILEDDIERVKVTIEVREGTPVKTDSRAYVERNFLTGIASIDILGGTSDAELLSEAAPSMESPLIPEGQPRLERMIEGLPEVIEDANVVAKRAAEFLSQENRERFSQILKNLESFTETVASKNERVDRLLGESLALISDLREVAGNVDAAVRKASFSLSQNMNRLSDGVARATESLATTLERFDDPRALLVGPSTSDLGPGEGESR